jgi:hypothetical protein
LFSLFFVNIITRSLNFHLIVLYFESFTSSNTIKMLDCTEMSFTGLSLISFVILSNSDFCSAANPGQSLCKCPSAEIYPNSTLKELPFCGYELGADCRELQVIHTCKGPSAVPKQWPNDCDKMNNFFCNIASFDHRKRSCRDRYSCKAENMDCGRNRSANPGFIYLNYGK